MLLNHYRGPLEGIFASNLDMGAIGRFCAPRVHIRVLTMVMGGNKGPRFLHKYFKDIFNEGGFKALHRPSKKGSLTSKWDMGAHRRFFILGVDLAIMNIIE
jgi:hypothetical protein